MVEMVQKGFVVKVQVGNIESHAVNITLFTFQCLFVDVSVILSRMTSGEIYADYIEEPEALLRESTRSR